MNIRPIRTKSEYEQALRAASAFFDTEPEPGTPDGDRFELLLLVIDAYEAANCPIAPPDPIDAIKFRMAQQGLSAADLVPMIGKVNRVYEILNRKRALTLPMIQRLHAGLGISADVLIGPTSRPAAQAA